jgi:hypothetical protein
MPRGANPKREREYRELEHRFKQEGRYKGREEEVAARIVNKQRAQYGETKGEQAQEKRGEAPDRNLPIKDYQHLTVDEIANRLGKLSPGDLEKIKSYEEHHKNRKTLIEQIDRRLGAA